MIELECGGLVVRLDEASGSLARLRDRATGATLLDAGGERAHFGRLFRVIAPVPGWSSRQLDSWASPPPTVVRGASGALELTWDRLSTPDGLLPVRAAVSLRRSPDAPGLDLRLELHNETDRELTDVLFPWLGGLAPADASAATVTLGGARQVPMSSYPRNLGLTFQRWHQRDHFTYPIDLYCPWVDVSGPGGGLGLLSRQREARNIGAVIENLAGYGPGLVPSVALAHFPVIGPGERWASPVVSLLAHEGDWRATADRYREWVEGWLPEPRTPEWARRTIGFQNVMFRSFEGRPVRRFRDIPAIARHGRDHGVDHVCVWDYVTLGDYSKVDDVPRHGFGLADREELRAALAEARALGVHVSALENYRLVKPTSRLYRDELRGEACQRYDGSPFVEEYCSSGAHGRVIVGHVGPYVHPMDARGLRYRRHVLGLVRDSLELGFDSLFHDQPFENQPSYNPLRGRDDPDGAHAAVVSLLAEVRALIHERGHEGIVVGEYCDVLATPSVDSWMAWYTDLDDLERSLYSIPRTLQSVVVDADPAVATRGFLLGAQLCLTTHGCEGTLADVPDFARHVAALARLRRDLVSWAGPWRLASGPIELTSDGPATARAFSARAGRFVICGSPGGAGRVELEGEAVLPDPSAEGWVAIYLDGRRERLVPSDGRLSIALAANGIAVLRPEPVA